MNGEPSDTPERSLESRPGLEEDSPWESSRVAVCLLALTLAAIRFRGYHFGDANQSLQIPYLKHLIDPSLYPGDPLISSFAGYPTAFFSLLSVLVRVTHSLERTYFSLFVLSEWAAVGALWVLARLFFGDKTAAILTCVLYASGIEGPGHEETTPMELTHGSVVAALLLWDLYLYLRGRRFTAFLVCGILFNFHALYSLQVALLFLADELFEGSGRESVKGFGAFLLLALPTLWWARAGEAVGHWDLYLSILRERSGLHVFPSVTPLAGYARYLLILAVGALGFSVESPKALKRQASHFAIALVAMWVAAFVFSEWIPVLPVMRAQFLRSTRWASIGVMLYGGALLSSAFTLGGLGRVGAAAILVGILLRHPAWLSFGLLVILASRRSRIPFWAVVVASVAILGCALEGLTSFETAGGFEVIRPLVDRVLADPLVLGPLLLVGLFASPRPSPRAILLGLLILVGFVGPAIYRAHIGSLLASRFVEAQLFFRDHTPKDALVLTPPDLEGFRVFSERRTVGEWKDGTQQFFSPSFAEGWYERMGLFGKRFSYDTLGGEALESLGRRFGAGYVLCRPGQIQDNPPRYTNDRFAVYALTDAKEDR